MTKYGLNKVISLSVSIIFGNYNNIILRIGSKTRARRLLKCNCNYADQKLEISIALNMMMIVSMQCQYTRAALARAACRYSDR